MQITEHRGAAGSTYTVEPKPNAASEGRLCIKGMNAYQHALSGSRLTYPMARVDGKLERVSWDEAYRLIQSNFTQLQQQYGKDTVGVYGGGSLTNESAYLLGKFARVALHPNISIITDVSACLPRLLQATKHSVWIAD